jgi:hypothetical protein
MANSDKHQAWAREQDIVTEHGQFTAAAGPPTEIQGCIATLTRTGVGTYTGTFKRKYPQVRSASVWPLLAAGGKGVFTAFDPKAGTFGLLLSNEAGTANDLATAVVRISVNFSNTTVTRR